MSNAAPSKPLPKDAHVVTAILKDMGIHQYEPRVVQQMLEFVYRYVASVLDDAKVYAGHAKKKNIDLDDVKLSVAMQTERSFTSPPPREILLEIARARNSSPLPTVKPHCGLRLPPDRYCLSSCNYRLKPLKKTPAATGSINLPTVRVGGAGSTVVRTTVSRVTPGGATNTGYTPRTSTYTPRPSAPRPVIKLNLGGASTPSSSATSVNTPMPSIQIAAPGGAAGTPITIKAEVKQEPLDESLKRKREDDDYDV